MGKVVAILNEPQSCLFCEFGHSVICAAKHNHMTDEMSPEKYEEYNIYNCKFNGTKPNWCPLKYIPEKANDDPELDDEYFDGFVDGWNECIDEILEEKGEC